ncbi:hypothetical protein LZC95_39740 [Pendulispora brunnea]|uniref:Uncharacterized protein n=1 Tax=Pendulispora brunnea TaxID=2905690 RepID=A0ABZ2K1F8_9BACT
MKSASISLGFVLIALGACSSGQAAPSSDRNNVSPSDAADASDGGAVHDAGDGGAVHDADDGGSAPDAGGNAAPLGQVGAATDGTQAFFVWTGGVQAGVHGARIAEDGTILGRVTLASDTTAYQNVAAAGYDGQHFLVAWLNGRPGYWTLSLHGSRVSRQGQSLDSQPIVIGSPGSGLIDDLHVGTRVVVAGGAGFFDVGWANGSYGNVRVDGSGSVGPATEYRPPDGIQEQFPAAISLNGSLVTLCAFAGAPPRPGGPPTNPEVRVGDCHSYPDQANPNGGYSSSSVPALAYGGNTLAQVWSYQDKYQSSMIAVQGRIGEHPFSIGGSARDVEVGFDGTYFHVVWLTNQYNASALMEQRIRVDGSLVDSPVTLEPSTSHVADGISVACPGTTCMVGFHDDAGIGVIRLAGAGPGPTERIALAPAP